MDNIEYQNAFTEILEILTYISKEDYEKIPNHLIEIFENNSNKTYKFKYDYKKSLEEQGCSDITKTILSLLYRDYWADDDEKRDLLLEEKKLRNKYQNELIEWYNPDDIFKKKNKMKCEITEETAIEVFQEEKWYQKIFNIVKKLFKKMDKR